MTRGTATLIGVAAAGLLLWLATQLDAEQTGGYWARVGLFAAAGLTMALAQLLGGWTKWGWPRLAGGVFLLGFAPALVAGGLVLLHAQPDAGALGAGLAGDLGLGDLAEDLSAVVPALAFGLGLAFGVTFDTTGRVRPTAPAEEEVRRGYAGPVPARAASAADEPTTAERRAVAHGDVDGEREGVPDREEVYAGGHEPERPRRRLFHR